MTLSASPPGDSNGCCLVDAVNQLWSYALREVLTARDFVGTVHHHLDPTTREQILAKACRLYYGYAPRLSGLVVLPPGLSTCMTTSCCPQAPLLIPRVE